MELFEFVGGGRAERDAAIDALNWWLFTAQKETPQKRAALLAEYKGCIAQIEAHYGKED